MLQTVAIRSLGVPSRHRGLARLLRQHAEATDEHPFVRRYAELLLHALHDGGWRTPLDWTRYVWRTEQDAVATDWEVSVVGSLAADAILLSNLIYEGCAPEDFFGQRGFEIAAQNSLPYCLSKSIDRRELLTGACPSECSFGLCPYPISAQRPRAIFTEGFCRAQRRQALKEGEPPWVGSGGLPQLRRRRFARFWSEMDQRVVSEPIRLTTL